MDQRKISVNDLYQDLAQQLSALRKDPSAVRRSRELVEQAIKDGALYYGINTGFGALADKQIPASELSALQTNLLLSHAVGVGDLIPKEISRLMLQLKIYSLGLGHSGISEATFERLLFFAEKDLVPAVPKKGSVGASGDLAPLAHMCLPLIGRGSFWDAKGKETVPAKQVLSSYALAPIALGAKDGLSLINGTQMMAAYGAFILEKSISMLKLADVLAAMSLEAFLGRLDPFDARVHALRPHPGQIAVSQNIRALVAGSDLIDSERGEGYVQDPYSLRCVPQVHGAARDALLHSRTVLDIEINSVTDNPLVFDDGAILSGGNFHGEPLALALDYAAIALAELASISERRTYLLLKGRHGLPRLLMRDTGVNSGFMIPQYTAAALVSENKVLCHPASVDSIPTSLGQEDHVSMGSISATKLHTVTRNVEDVMGIELFTVAQALDFRAPKQAGRGVKAAHQFVRSEVGHTEVDRRFENDIGRCLALIRNGKLLAAVEGQMGTLL